MIFDGRAFAKEIEDRVKTRLRQGYGGRRPKILSILVGTDPASVLYTRLKAESAKRCGVEFEVVNLSSSQDIAQVINDQGKTVDGIMIQLPIPGLSKEETARIIEMIPLSKDVDGLRWEESGVMSATVKAVVAILATVDPWQRKFVVVGSRGSVGRPLVHFLKKKGVLQIVEVNSETKDLQAETLRAEILISCTGRAGLIKEDMIGSGLIAIDVGSPRGEMTKEVYQKASFATPVPGGVGPVTVACLMENTLELLK